ncbi:MAG TPA: cob(I)yrinic acid a,c-diamide adenosyltransferase [Herpetosiphonaceae bacterium]|nr:cob(I)yrinic acid a,c-diamide adenosyltransferase [Herpetosiphonaceae bacterium]
MFFTRRGDDGNTDLIGGPRLPKDDLRIAALGDLDEATSAIGLARASARGEDTRAALLHTQKDLYLLMADVATTTGQALEQPRLASPQIDALEAVITGFDGRVSIPKEFVASGDSIGGATLDVARSVVRRAERTIAHLLLTGSGANPDMVRYLNRLSSLLFGLARYEDSLAGVAPTISKEIVE